MSERSDRRLAAADTLASGAPAREHTAACPETAGPEGSAELRGAVQLCLRARQAMAVWVGPELAVVANESYWATLRYPTPGPRGIPAAELWASAWPELAPRVDAALAGAPCYEADRRLVLAPPPTDPSGPAVVVHVSHSLTPIFADPSDDPALRSVVGLVHVLDDTSDRVRRDRNLQRVFELAHDVLVVETSDDRFVEINPAFTRVLGWSRAEALAQPREFFVHPEDRAQTEAALAALSHGATRLEYENRYRRPDGSYRWLAWTAASIPREGLIYAAARDVTEQRLAEEHERRALTNAAFRLRLADSLRPLGDPLEVQQRAAQELGLALAATRVLYANVSDDGAYGLVTAEYRVPGVESMLGRHRLAEYGFPLRPELRAGRPLIVDDVAADERLGPDERLSFAALDVGACVILPLIKTNHPVAVMAVHQARPRAWSSADLGLIEDTADRTWAAVERARVEEALRESKQRLQQILRHAAAGVFDWDIVTGELYWSPENYELHGVDPSEPLHYGVWERVVFPADLPATLERVRAAVEGRAPEFYAEFRVLHPTLGPRWLVGVGRVERGPSGEPTRMRGLNLDISKRKQIEEEAREADRRKTEFLAVLSHELRNPLAPIRNSIELLRAVPGDSELAERAKQVLDRQSAHLIQIVDDLLDVTRISRGKIRLDRRRHDLREIVRRTADDLWTSFDEAGVSLALALAADPVWIDADATRIAQIVTNLLQNSLKFAPGGAVRVDVEATPEGALLRVRDDGVGMTQDQLARMFEPFAQAEQPLARPLGGLGLGLSLVKGLTELHGGSVEAQSEGAGAGTQVVVQLPLADPSAAPRATPAASAREPSVRVLVIEDNPDAGQILADLLRVRGHEVRLASDGRSGLRLAERFEPEVVVCDLGLPDMSGYEVAEALRGRAGAGPRLLIALSGYAQPEDRARARTAGFDAHLPKPAPLEQLYALLGAGASAPTPVASAADALGPEPESERR